MQRKQTSKKLQQQATQIAADIFHLTNQYTNDSALSKFFLPNEINQAMYITAGGFASTVYEPSLEIEDIQKATILPFFLILMTYGFQIYVKERSIKTNSAPYRLPTDDTYIKMANQQVLTKAIEGTVLSTPLADAVINIILRQIEKNVDVEQYQYKGYTLDLVKVRSYETIALYFGYNFASFLINRV